MNNRKTQRRRLGASGPWVSAIGLGCMGKRGIEREILPACRELGIGLTAYGVLSRGLISGHWSGDRALAPGDFRNFAARFSD